MSFVMMPEQREEFLAGVHIGVVAVNRDGRAPLTTPVWYGYTPGGEVTIWIHQESLKARLMKRSGRFSICAQDETPPYRYVTAEGPVLALEENPPKEQVVAIAERYMSNEEAADWVEENLSDNALLVRMRPEQWLSADYGKAKR